MKRKVSEQLAIISECLQEIQRGLEDAGDGEVVYTASDRIESAACELEGARRVLAQSGW
ncbi:hypothetical protein [Stomatobaculum longum]|uniref:hypothetical protein n=1 Tax=Stomatobaculum longum TaxID=796942 RepID=UPI0028DCC78C|nr:hypothetical protein [Stomatobaculum longum]